MSKVTNTLQTNNQLITNYDVSKLQLGGNEHVTGSYTASGETTLEAGLLMGKVAATGALVEVDPTASNGSQFVFGILWLGLNESITLDDGEVKTLTLINKGRVAEAKLVMPTGVTLDDVITGDGRTVKDYLNDKGLILEGGVELSKTDNQ